MAKRLSIPETSGQAERFLWHSIDHLRSLQDLTDSPVSDAWNRDLSDAETMLRRIITGLQTQAQDEVLLWRIATGR